ncbi:MAG: hypothetical protein D6688_08450 [Alphaproteobacteria bacterium]|nr:MAG: hypothetical protein D6688_08450 [Alphaproteobacteria bacterium]
MRPENRPECDPEGGALRHPVRPGPRAPVPCAALTRAALAFCLAAGGLFAASPAGAEVCVVNGSDERLLFVAREGETSQTAELGPGERLCASSTPEDRGTASVSVYRDADALEGCTRLARPGHDETLLSYADFDRCAWSSMTE